MGGELTNCVLQPVCTMACLRLYLLTVPNAKINGSVISFSVMSCVIEDVHTCVVTYPQTETSHG